MRIKLNHWFLLVMVVVLVFIAGCASEKKDWEKAKSENTITAYEEFLKQYPKGEFADQSRTRIEKIYFKRAQTKNTIPAYKDFLKRYPKGTFADSARVEIEYFYFEQAQVKNTITAYEDFLKRYSQGPLADSARTRIEKLYFENAESKNTIQAYEEFLKNYPKSQFFSKITEKIEVLECETTQKRGKKKETAKSLSFSVTEVVQKSDYSVIYVKIDPMKANLPWALSRETIHAVNKEGVKIPMEGAALRKTIVFGLSAFTINLDEEGDLSFEIPESGEVQLLFVLHRQLKEFEIALAFKTKKEELVSLEIDGIGIARWSQH